ncbi:hypothetical protein PVAP13_7NG441833 [Panicum virgatum]|uniref:Uncharacterized protein n=1 Tax=Panicum virgatum TaxID=38727 RepID=A0A8T0Q8V2_PANVG|nr:hypothetical protein PVAP13_7NG441833 [Panicum virgatum]
MSVVQSGSEVGHEEELDFHLEATDDISWDDDNILPARYPSSLEEDENGGYDEEMFRTMSHAADRHTTSDEYWDIVKKTFSSEAEAFFFYNKYARDKG